jgi:hypothetical protein
VQVLPLQKYSQKVRLLERTTKDANSIGSPPPRLLKTKNAVQSSDLACATFDGVPAFVTLLWKMLYVEERKQMLTRTSSSCFLLFFLPFLTHLEPFDVPVDTRRFKPLHCMPWSSRKGV